MTVDKTRKAQGERLADARSRAGWRSARAAALENGWAESSYRAHENGSRTIGQDDAETYARRFRLAGVQISAQEILFGSDHGARPQAPADVGPPLRLTDAAPAGGARDLPSYGTAVGGDAKNGDFRLNSWEATEMVARPPALVGRKRAFCVTMQNDSMSPVYKPGKRVYVDPDGPRPSIGDDVLIEMYPEEDGEPGSSYVKTLVSRGSREVVLTQYNPPPAEIRLDATHIKQILRVIPYDELLNL